VVPDDNLFGVRLRGLIEAKGLSIVEFANAYGLGESQTHNWLHKADPPLAKHWPKLATFFGCSVEYIISGTPKKLEPSAQRSSHSNLGSPPSGLVLEEPALFEVSHGNPMRITPGHEPPSARPTEQTCHDHLAEYLRRGRMISGWIALTYIELREKFPLERPERLKQESP
jgi:transcriptional regulator with XRE-family HTH domain